MICERKMQYARYNNDTTLESIGIGVGDKRNGFGEVKKRGVFLL